MLSPFSFQVAKWFATYQLGFLTMLRFLWISICFINPEKPDKGRGLLSIYSWNSLTVRGNDGVLLPVDKILWSYHSNKTSLSVLSHGTIRIFSILQNEIWKFLSHFATFGSERVIERNTFDHLDVWLTGIKKWWNSLLALNLSELLNLSDGRSSQRRLSLTSGKAATL